MQSIDRNLISSDIWIVCRKSFDGFLHKSTVGVNVLKTSALLSHLNQLQAMKCTLHLLECFLTY